MPEWVRTAAHQPLPAYPAETNAVVLLDETTYTVKADGRATVHYRQVIRILRPQGRRDAVVAVGYDRESHLTGLHIWSIGPGGREYALKENEIADHGYSGDTSLYVEDRVKEATAPGSDPGGTVAYEYEQQQRPYLTEKTWFFQDNLPHRKQSFTLELPPGFEYGAVWARHPASSAINLEHQRWLRELTDTPGIDLDRAPLRPSPLSLAGRMTIHYTGPGLPDATVGTWKSIGEWYTRLEQDRLAATPEITAKAMQLTTGKTDFYEKTEALGEFVQQQVRYFGIELGIGGYQPHRADEVFRNRYGDCKDKATLLAVMLSAAGVHAALVMVDTHRDVIDPDAPSIVGNHMIVAIEIPAGYTSAKLRSVVTAKTGRRYLIFDPTWDKTPFGQLENNLQGGFGMLIEGADSQAIALPVLSPELNTIHRSATFQLDADGTLTGSVTERRFGDVSEDHRIYYGSREVKEQQEYLDHALEHDFTSFKVSSVTTSNAGNLNQEFALSYNVRADHFGRSLGTLMMVRPRVLGSDDISVDKKLRTVPIDLRETLEEIDDFTITLAAGYALDELPEPITIDVGFATYESSCQMKGNTLHYHRTYKVRQVTLPPDKYSDVQHLAAIINADEQRQAVFQKQP